MMAGNRSVKPKGIKVLGNQRTLRIEWATGEVSNCTFGVLRKNCPCAECRTERDKETGQLVDETSGELQLRSSAELTIGKVQLVGNYALQIEWSDGHKHGIYTWEYLQELCSGNV
jgi:DUF971 family protein